MDDISIIDIDLAKTTWSRVHSSMRTLYLKLSAEPDLDWIRLFREERESRVVIKRHGLWVEDGYIVFDCLLADVERHHLPDFRKSIAYANQHCRELKDTRRSESRQRQADARDEEQQLAALRARVRDNDAAKLAEARSAAAAAVNRAAASRAAAKPIPAASADLNSRRKELRARFRAAMKNKTRESDRG
jgi:hypothetical protein